jgi:hypothetical protein
VKGGELDEALFSAYMNSIELICRSFAPVVVAVAFGAATFDEILKKAKEQNKS